MDDVPNPDDNNEKNEIEKTPTWVDVCLILSLIMSMVILGGGLGFIFLFFTV